MGAQDLFGQALRDWSPDRLVTYEIERDDGLIASHDIAIYFRPFEAFSTIEKQALGHVRGRVLDVGCGAGRHALHLQEQGLAVTAIDLSPDAVAVARARGVEDARVASACHPLPFDDGSFDTVLLLGNTFGICGDWPRTRAMLREFRRVTGTEATLIAHSSAPGTTNPIHLKYLRRNLERGRTRGLVTVRLRYDGRVGPWFDLLFLSPDSLLDLAWEEGWAMRQVYSCGDLARGYAAVLERR